MDVSVEEIGPLSVEEVGPMSVEEDVVQEAEELKHGSLPAPVLPSTHLPFRSWCSACVRGRGLSLGHRKVDMKTKEAEQIPTVCMDYGQPQDRAHNTLPVLIVQDRRSKGFWSHPLPAKSVTHPYPAKALMTDLDFMAYKRVIFESDQEPGIVALCDAVKNGWHGEIVPEASPKGESKSKGEVERVVQSVHGLARTMRDFLEQQSGITLESRCPLLAWLVEHCTNLFLLFHKGEPHDGHTAFTRRRASPGESRLASASTTENALGTSWKRDGLEERLWVFE